MTTKKVRPDNSVTLVVGHIYQLIPSMGGQYVRLWAMNNKYCFFEGVDRNIADLKIPIWKSDEILDKDIGSSSGPSTSFLLLTTGDYLLLNQGDKLRLNQ